MTIMEKTIGLQFAGCADTGFDSLLSINWPGKNLADFMPREEYYVAPVAYFARIDCDYQTYEAVICKFEGIDLRHSAFQVAIRIPVGCAIVERSTGSIVSPAVVLRPILAKVMGENMKSFEDTYEYRGRQVPTFAQADYAAMLAPYAVVSVWGPMVDMTGSRPVYVNGTNDADIDQKLLCVPYIGRFSQAAVVEIGAFSASVSTTALTDDELKVKSEVQVRINSRSGAVDNRELTAVPMHLNSADFGYPKEIYKEITLKLTRENIFAAFRNNTLVADGEGYKVTLYPSKGIVAVQFDPPFRTKAFDIHLKGNVANRENEIYDQLLYNSKKVHNRKIAFSGEDIVRFESMTPEQLRDCFSLTKYAAFTIEKVRRDGSEISLTLKAKEEPRPVASSAPAPAKAPEGASAQKTMCVRFDVKGKAPKNIDVLVTQRINSDVESTTLFPCAEVKKGDNDYYSVVTFAELAGNPGIEVRLGRPSLFKGRPHVDGEKYDYEVHLSEPKGCIARFFSIFRWQPVSGSWPIWRAVSVACVVLLLGAICFCGGFFTNRAIVAADDSQSLMADSVKMVKERDKITSEITRQFTQRLDSVKAENDSLKALTDSLKVK